MRIKKNQIALNLDNSNFALLENLFKKNSNPNFLSQKYEVYKREP